MKLVIILAALIVVVWFVSLAFASAAKHEPPSVISRHRITVIYNIAFRKILYRNR